MTAVSPCAKSQSPLDGESFLVDHIHRSGLISSVQVPKKADVVSREELMRSIGSSESPSVLSQIFEEWLM
jgi:hypothetical protein